VALLPSPRGATAKTIGRPKGSKGLNGLKGSMGGKAGSGGGIIFGASSGSGGGGGGGGGGVGGGAGGRGRAGAGTRASAGRGAAALDVASAWAAAGVKDLDPEELEALEAEAAEEEEAGEEEEAEEEEEEGGGGGGAMTVYGGGAGGKSLTRRRGPRSPASNYRGVTCYKRTVGLSSTSRMQLTHSLRALAFNSCTYKVVSCFSTKFACSNSTCAATARGAGRRTSGTAVGLCRLNQVDP
jgi:hypothetical protein